MRRRVLLLTALVSAALAIVAITQTGGPTRTLPAAPPVVLACPQAAAGQGHPGVCAPRLLQLTAPKPMGLGGVVTFEDRSNNDPCYCGQAIKAAGYVGLIVKAIQGLGFVDYTAPGMIASARRAGLTVGVYDFDQDYTVAEAQLFAARARAAGIVPHARNQFPLFIDVEFGAFSYSGLLAQIRYLRSLGYQVDIYTGDWYWTPHAGCTWPVGVHGWLSGYPFAIVPCGLPRALYVEHQFTSTPIDLSWFLQGRQAFERYVNDTSPARLVCFGPGAQLRNPTCRRVRPQLARYSRARTATGRALHRNFCRKPYRRRLCVVLGQRFGYFDHRAAALFKEFA